MTITPDMPLAEFLNMVVNDMAAKESRMVDFICTNGNLRLEFGVILMHKTHLETEEVTAS